jgi:hypothetical protein
MTKAHFRLPLFVHLPYSSGFDAQNRRVERNEHVVNGKLKRLPNNTHFLPLVFEYGVRPSHVFFLGVS